MKEREPGISDMLRGLLQKKLGQASVVRVGRPHSGRVLMDFENPSLQHFLRPNAPSLITGDVLRHTFPTVSKKLQRRKLPTASKNSSTMNVAHGILKNILQKELPELPAIGLESQLCITLSWGYPKYHRQQKYGCQKKCSGHNLKLQLRKHVCQRLNQCSSCEMDLPGHLTK